MTKDGNVDERYRSPKMAKSKTDFIKTRNFANYKTLDNRIRYQHKKRGQQTNSKSNRIVSQNMNHEVISGSVSDMEGTIS
jgi:hypothetical protein